MATWLHDAEIYASIAESSPGAAADWATSRLAIYAPERFKRFPDDERCHDVVLAAAPPTVLPAYIEALRTTRPCTPGLANAGAALGIYGLLPSETSELGDAFKGALGKNGQTADIWLSYALSMIDEADPTALSAAAAAVTPETDWVLPIVLLRVAAKLGALDEAAKEVAAEIHAQSPKDPHRLFAILVAMGVPLGPLAQSYRELEQAVHAGSHLAHRAPPSLTLNPGSIRRRQHQAVRQLLEGITDPAAALLRAVFESKESHAEWGLWPVAIAAWMRASAQTDDHHHGDPLHDVLHHGSGGIPPLLAEARREVDAEHAAALREAVEHHPDVSTGLLALTCLRRGGDAGIAEALLRMHGGNGNADIRTAAIACVAATHTPDTIPNYIASSDPLQRTLGLVCAEWVPTTEVLEALLQAPIPADPTLKLQYTRALAAMGDAATLGHLQALKAEDENGILSEPLELAQELLRVSV